MLIAAIGAGTALAAFPAAAPAAPSASPALGDVAAATHLRRWMRLVADLDGAVTWSHTAGTVYGFRPQADEVSLAEFVRPLYQYRALVVRQIVEARDDRYRVRQQAWSHYCDVASGAPIDELDNPYTGRRVQCPPMGSPASVVMHTPDGIVRDAATFPAESSEVHAPFRLGYAAAGDRVAVRREVYSRFRTPDIEWYKLEADVTAHDVARRDLLDERTPRLPHAFAHNLVAEWQTWMKMHGTPGHILFSGLGRTHVALDVVAPEVLSSWNRRFPGTIDSARAWSGAARS